MLDKYCVKCHNTTDNIPAGKPLYLDEANLDDVAQDASLWELVIRKLGVGAMPPLDKPHPPQEELAGFRTWLMNSLDMAARQTPNPGEYIIHRLNRTEYANAIRDLLGVRVDVSGLLPSDSADFGFDNVATGLQTSAALIDRYITAAVRVSEIAVGNPHAEAAETKFPMRVDVNQAGYIPGLPLGTRGGQLVHFNFPADGEYNLSASLYRTTDSSDRGIEGQETPNEFVVEVDGVPVHSATIGGPADHSFSIRNFAAAREAVAKRMKLRTFIKAGPHDVVFTFVDRPSRSQDIYETALRSSEDIHDAAGRPTLTSASIVGPLAVKGLSDTVFRDRIYVCHPNSAGQEPACARRILSSLATRAYRRPLTDDDMRLIMAFYEQARKDGGDFDAGIRAALPRILTSLAFLFRTEHDPDGLATGAAHPVTDLELASRLSFFLWSSVPDDELLKLAIDGKLRKGGVLQQQVRRMLADERSTSLTTNFPDQWLALRNLERISPDILGFPNWDVTLRNDLQQETHLFFASLLHDDRSALDLLNADYTFVNERVARHYGIPGVYGTAFRRVHLADPNRRGLLGQGSILALTSVATRTSPVFRGKWVLTNLLDVPPLPPPPNVPALAENSASAAPKSVRERLEAHRANAVCASCHRNMDPIGFALESFDATGQWRAKTEDGRLVDSAGVLLDGTPLDGPVTLRAALSRRPDVFVGTVTEKLMIYALGRGLQPYDMPVVRDIVRQTSTNGYRLQDIIMGIVQSLPFQMRTKTAVPDDKAAVPIQAMIKTRE
jgi:cytochrome c553